MDKSGTKRRDISFHSSKNQSVVCIHGRDAREYARILEQDDMVINYEAGYVLEKERYQFVSPLDIRKDYFSTDWQTDFVLHYADGSLGIREIITEASLSKRATIEKLEFSRRYWSASEASDWKIVIMESHSTKLVKDLAKCR